MTGRSQVDSNQGTRQGGSTALYLVLLSLGCAEQPREAFTSCGARAAEAAEVAELTARRLREVSEAEPGVPFGRIADASMGTNGDLYVADPLSSTVVRISGSGDATRYLGRRGEGPGEFLVVTEIEARAGGLTAFDTRLWRATTFDTLGDVADVLRTTPQPDIGQLPEVKLAGGRIYNLGFGSFEASVTERAAGRSDAIVRGSNSIELWNPDSHRWERLIVAADGEQVFVQDGQITSIPYSPRLLWAPTAAGGVWYADSRGSRLRHRRQDGRKCEIDVHTAPVPVTPEERARFYDAVDLASASPDRIREARNFRRAVPVPDTKPALRRLLASRDEMIWVLAEVEAEEGVWSVYREDGQLTHRVRVGPDLDLKEVSAGTGVAIRESDLGEQTIVVLEW